MKKRSALLIATLALATIARAGSTGTVALHMPQGDDAGTANGDYVSDNAGLNTVYRYWIEVPPGLGRLVVEVFDADVGRGGGGEDDVGRDRDRGGGFTTQADYRLFRPDASAGPTLLNCSNTTCNDNAWQAIMDSTTAVNTAAGHWELRIEMDGGNDINAIGIRAHDGTSGAGGTELNVYADSMMSLGVNPDPGSNTQTFTLYPWITSGCQASQNDFDRDTDSGNTGSVVYRSRMHSANPATGFTQTFASTTLSVDDDWNHDNLTRWGDDDESDDYGVWTFSPTITTYGSTSGNYETTYVGSYLAAGDPTANPMLSGGNPAAFRVYLPTDAGVAPVKPYLEQFLTHNRTFTGPNPTVAGTQTVFTVTIRITNPTIYALTFNASNLVSTNVPGGGVTYHGNPTFTQGSVTAAPAIGGTGTVSWNPGSVLAGTSALFAYDVRVTPPSGARVLVTPAPATATSTRAQYIDETGNATQTRARYLMGGLCELAITPGLATEALLSSFSLDVRGGATDVEWSTASEAGTIGFNIYRAATGEQVNSTLIPASMKAHGGKYRLLDTGNADPSATYIVEEVTASGNRKRYGPLNHLVGVDRDELRRRDGRRFEASTDAVWQPSSDAAKEKIVAAMIGVRETGIVRVPAASLAEIFGEKEKAITKAMDTGKVSVSFNGNRISWTTDGQNLLFFGEKSTSIYSNERVYRVELIAGTTMQAVQWTPANVPVSSAMASRELETNAFVATVVPLDPASDFYFWDFVLSGDPTLGRKTFNVNVPAMASASGASLQVRLQGALKDAAHTARISINGSPLGEQSWSSFDANSATLNIPPGVLLDGANAIEVEGVLAPGAPFDVFYVDGFTVNYQKFARPEAGQVAVRTLGALGAGPFTAAPTILDVSTPTRPVIVRGASFQAGTASVNVPSTKSLYLSETFLAPSSLRGSPEVKFKGKLRADWLIIAPRSMRGPAESLAQLRQQDGLSTFVADLEQIYDEFAGGNVTPLAIRDFIRSTRSWSPAPRYIALAGIGSVDYLGVTVSPGTMPPILTATPDGIYAADSLYTDFNADGLPDVAIGRIPVASAAELSAYVAKLDANARINVSTTPIVFSADAADGAASFRAESELAEGPLADRPATRVYLDDLGGSGARSALLAAWQAGTPLVSWVGHGGLDQLSNSGVLTSYDAASLDSAGRLPVLVAMTCTINRFENGFVDPLGVALTRETGGGALAVWSATGLSQHGQAGEIQRTFMHLAAQASPTTRLGDLIVRALAAHKSDTASIYLLLGDPAIRLDLPTEVTNGGSPSATGE